MISSGGCVNADRFISFSFFDKRNTNQSSAALVLPLPPAFPLALIIYAAISRAASNLITSLYARREPRYRRQRFCSTPHLLPSTPTRSNRRKLCASALEWSQSVTVSGVVTISVRNRRSVNATCPKAVLLFLFVTLYLLVYIFPRKVSLCASVRRRK